MHHVAQSHDVDMWKVGWTITVRLEW